MTACLNFDIKLPLPLLPEQKRLVVKVRKLAQQIAAAPARKQAILQPCL